jgi:hypothetical protein
MIREREREMKEKRTRDRKVYIESSAHGPLTVDVTFYTCIIIMAYVTVLRMEWNAKCWIHLLGSDR